MKQQTIKDGIITALASITFLWFYPIVCLYLGIPALSALVGLTFSSIMLHMIPSFEWFGILSTLLITYCGCLIILFATVCLIIHAIHILRAQSITVMHVIKKALSKSVLISQWALFETARILFVQSIIVKSYPGGVLLFGIILLIAWSLYTSLVPVFIALEHTTLPRAIISSFLLIQSHFITIISGIALLTSLGALLTAGLKTVPLLLGAPYEQGLIRASLALIIICSYLFMSARTLFVTFIYHDISSSK